MTSVSMSLIRGKVQEVQFYESNVGQPNKSIVTLLTEENASRMLLLDGDARSALPVGRRVEIKIRKDKDGGPSVLANVEYL